LTSWELLALQEGLVCIESVIVHCYVCLELPVFIYSIKFCMM